MRQKVGLYIGIVGIVLLGTLAVAFSEECLIVAVKHRVFESGTIGYSAAPTERHKVTIIELELENKSDKAVKLNWKGNVPTLTSEGRQIRAVRLLVPNWLPIAGGVGPYSTETKFGGEEIEGFLEIEKDTWCDWLAIDEIGSKTGDHISISVESVTVTLTKGKRTLLKFLFPAEVSFPHAKLAVPGCSEILPEVSEGTGKNTKSLNTNISDLIDITIAISTKSRAPGPCKLSSRIEKLIEDSGLSSVLAIKEPGFPTRFMSYGSWVIELGSEWGIPVTISTEKIPKMEFRNGEIGIVDTEIYVKDGTEAKIQEKHYVFKNGKWKQMESRTRVKPR